MAHGKYELIDMSRLPVSETKHDAQLAYNAKTPLEPYGQGTEETSSLDERRPRRSAFSRTRARLFNSGWRGGLIRWTALSTAIWLVNIIVYICLFATTQVTHGSGLVMTQTCTVVSATNTVVHLALNTVTTLMLSASTYAMESLCCPTRLEIDKAHAKGRWLGIGGLSLRNFRFISTPRSILWMSLWITSIPLHLFFNAVFFTSSQTHQYAVAVATEEYLTSPAIVFNENTTSPRNFANLGGYLNQSEYERPDDNVIVSLLDEARQGNTLATLDPAQCRSIYGTGFVRNAGDVVVVVDSASANDTLVWTRYPLRVLSPNRKHTNQDGFNWICHDVLEEGISIDGKKPDRCTSEVIDYINEFGNWTVYGSAVQSCLSRSYPPTCHLLFNVWLMLAVLVIGVLKTMIMFYIIFGLSSEHNLRTFGDAVSSFLQREDPSTKGMCLVPSSAYVKDGLKKYPPQLYTGSRSRWWRSAGIKQYFATLASTILYLICLGVALDFAIDGAFGTAFDSSLGQANIQSLTKVESDDTSSTGLIPNLLVANVPQLGISLLYMAYNDVLSRMLMADEFDKFTRQQKPVRISEKTQGAQRGTRYFSLPMRWAIPQMIGGALLHWLASASLFAVRVDGVDRNSVVDTADQLSRLGYNARAIVGMIVVLLLIACSLVYIGFWKRFDVCLGEMGNSLVISAACHPTTIETDQHMKAISWGDVTGHGGSTEGVRHCSFSAQEPVRPIRGAYYA